MLDAIFTLPYHDLMRKQLFVLFATQWLAHAALAEVPKTIRACGDAAEFPPFQYFERQAGRKTDRVGGFDVALLRKIMADSGHEIQFELLPWLRCLVKVSTGEFDIAMDGIKSPVRENEFLFSQVPHYSLSPIFLYLKSNRKPGMDSPAALRKESVCSQAGYNYAPFGVPDSLIRNRATSIEDSAQMLRLKRCTVMLQQKEVLRGHAILGGEDLLSDKDFAYEVPAWIRQIDFYFMVSKSLPHRAELLEILDLGMARLEKSGEMSRLRNAYYLQPVQTSQKIP